MKTPELQTSTEGHSTPCGGSAPSLIYLATPYSHAEAAVREARFHAVNRVAAELMARGLHIFSPISHTHPIAEAGDLPRGWDYWQAYDRAILRCCCKLIVLQLDGWQQSAGVAGEVAIAEEMGIEIEFMAQNVQDQVQNPARKTLNEGA